MVRETPWRLSLSLAVVPAAAWAHPAAEPHGDAFVAGLVHPTGGLEHQLAMLAIGLWAAQLSAARAALVPLAFLAGAAGGLLAGGGSAAPAPWLLAVPVAALGIALLRTSRWPPLAAAAVALGCGILHGHAHVLPSGTTATAGAFAAGFLATTALLHAASFASVRLLPLAGRSMVARASGLVLTLAGVALVVGRASP